MRAGLMCAAILALASSQVASKTCEEIRNNALVNELGCNATVLKHAHHVCMLQVADVVPEDQVRNPDPAELQVALASKIGLYEELCPLIKSDGYDAFCTHAAWQKMVGCEYGNPAAASFAPCTGSRPSESVPRDQKCDFWYSCIDRSDEEGCQEDLSQPYVYQLETDEEKKRAKKFDFLTTTDDYSPVDHNEQTNFANLHLVRCVLDGAEDGVQIGDACFANEKLCRHFWNDSMGGYFFHPQHLAICRNYSFWSEPENQGYCGEGFIPCQGNYPGFCMEEPKEQEIGFMYEMFKAICVTNGTCADWPRLPWTSVTCPDGSQTLFGGNTWCDNDPDGFKCKDGTKCIHNFLACDGHVHCADGSDEDPAVCSDCRRGFGFPRRIMPRSETTDLWKAVFACRHRYTGRPICSEACDGVDGLCEGFADEQCQVYPFHFLLLYVAATIVMLTAVVEVGLFLLRRKALTRQATVKRLKPRMSLLEREMEVTDEDMTAEQYEGLREEDGFADALLNLVQYAAYKGDIAEAEAICQRYYEMERQFQKGDGSAADLFFLDTLGTNKFTSVFYDMTFGSPLIRLRKWLLPMVPSGIRSVVRSMPVRKLTIMGYFCLTVLFHYTDMIKDILLLAQLWVVSAVVSDGSIYVPPFKTIPVVVSAIVAATILLSETLNLVTMVRYPQFKNLGKGRYVALVFAPAARAFIRYREAVIKYQMERSLYAMRGLELAGEVGSEDFAESEVELIKYRQKLRSLQLLRYEFRSNDNMFEHFPQLIILSGIIVATKMTVPTETFGPLSRIFLNENSYFIALSTCLSLTSVVVGQIFYKRARDGGFTVMVGFPIQAAYYILSTVGRSVLVILLTVPILGLFPVVKQGFAGIVKPAGGFRFVDIKPNGSSVTFQELWSPLHYQTVFALFGNKYKAIEVITIALPVAIVIGHFAVGFALNRQVCGRLGKLKTALSCFYTFVCPPLFLDWKEFHLANPGKSITSCWRESRSLFLKYVALFTFEHFLLMVPMFMLKSCSSQRNQDLMAAGFELLSAEREATLLIDRLLGWGLAIALLILPASQIALAVLYFKYGHPWSRILNAQVDGGLIRVRHSEKEDEGESLTQLNGQTSRESKRVPADAYDPSESESVATTVI